MAAPRDPLIWLDRSDGSIALALSMPWRGLPRQREDAQSIEQWQKSVGRVVAETAERRHTGAFVENLSRGASKWPRRCASQSILPTGHVLASAVQRLQACPRRIMVEPYGIGGRGVGAKRPLASLTSCSWTAPVKRLRHQTIVNAMSQPKFAARLVIATVSCWALASLPSKACAGRRFECAFGNLNDQYTTVTSSSAREASMTP